MMVIMMYVNGERIFPIIVELVISMRYCNLND